MRRQTPWRMGRREAVRLAAGKIESADSLRSFYLYVPGTYDQAAPAPLVLALHGHGTTGRNMEVLTHISRVADARGFIVAYPNGAHKGWNDGRPGVSENVDDVAFIRDLIVLLQSRYSIDPARIYATGISNGGFMCYRLACELASSIAAIAPVAATMRVGLPHYCRPARPVSVCLIHGTEDPFVPWNGGTVGRGLRRRGTVLSADQTIKYWVEVNGCDPDPVSGEIAPQDPAESTRATVTRYLNGREDSEVILYEVEGGGHAWPGGLQYLPTRFVGPASSLMDASYVIWDFFSRHKREG
jgi:polyhydroxybutyrate depolymerase